jgi:L-fuconolactonase
MAAQGCKWSLWRGSVLLLDSQCEYVWLLRRGYYRGRVTRIDAHQHFWKVARGDYRWLTPDVTGLYRDFLPDDLQGELAECGIDGTVLVQAAPSEAETRFLFELVRQRSTILGVVGWVDFEAQDVHRRIAALIGEGAGILKGLRPMVQDIEDPAWLAGHSLDVAFDALVRGHLVFDALVTPIHLDALTRRLRRHPGMKCVIDHAAKPAIGRPLDAWAATMHDIARTTSAHCKLSGLLSQCEGEATIEALDPCVARVFDSFGPERVIWGSDWPVLTLRGSYRGWLEMSLELVRRHAPDSLADVFAENARRVYCLEPV